MRVFFSNLGCKLNQAELEALARRFHRAGHDVVPSLAEADLHVVNSCTVTHVAARDSRKTARRGGRLARPVRTVLTGCYVESDPAAAAELAGVDLVVPNSEKDHLLERVHTAFPESIPRLGAARPAAESSAVPCAGLDFGNTRALVKVEDGCNMRCAFCVIPATRGRQLSRPPREIVAEIEGLAAAGFREVVLTGVQISSYRWQAMALSELVTHILRRTPIERLRLTSIAPWQLDPRLLDLLAEDRVCRHLHLSLQSGCDRTLRRMRRPYTAAEFLRLVDRGRSVAPGLAVTTDVIVGFPGETDDELRESLATVEAAGFARVHVFPYSQRPGTEAARRPDQVPRPVVRERTGRMLEVAEAAAHRFRKANLGRIAAVLWERHRQGRWLGTSDNYLKVVLRSEAELASRITRVRLDALDGDAMLAMAPTPAAPRR